MPVSPLLEIGVMQIRSPGRGRILPLPATRGCGGFATMADLAKSPFRPRVSPYETVLIMIGSVDTAPQPYAAA